MLTEKLMRGIVLIRNDLEILVVVALDDFFHVLVFLVVVVGILDLISIATNCDSIEEREKC